LPRPRKSIAELQLNGAFKHDPQRLTRRLNVPKPTKDIGRPPTLLTAQEKEVWKQVVRESPPGVLTVSDRMALTYLCRVWARYLKYGEHTGGKSKGVTSKQMQNVMQMFANFGMNPLARSKLHVPEEPGKNSPFAKFRNADEFQDEGDLCDQFLAKIESEKLN
jgi:phage terminase small subunit